jgi:drug/metabolite transporter (DMT)-like permease
MRKHAVHTVLACLVVYVLWGTTYPAIGLMLAPPRGQGLPPFFATGGRLVGAGAALLVLGQFSAHGRIATRALTRQQFRAAAVAGFFLCFSTAALVAGASQRLPSGAVASYLATAPIWATLMVSVTRRKAPGARVCVGLALGLAGVVVLSGSDITPDAMGVGLALGGAATWAFGSWYTSHSRSFPLHNWISGGLAQVTSGTGLIAVALMRSEQIPLPVPQSSQASLLAFGYLTFVSLIGLTTYSWLLKNRDPLMATTHAFINPLVAACVGAVALSEGLSVQLLVSAAMVGGGAFLTMPMTRLAGLPQLRGILGPVRG